MAAGPIPESESTSEESEVSQGLPTPCPKATLFPHPCVGASRAGVGKVGGGERSAGSLSGESGGDGVLGVGATSVVVGESGTSVGAAVAFGAIVTFTSECGAMSSVGAAVAFGAIVTFTSERGTMSSCGSEIGRAHV